MKFTEIVTLVVFLALVVLLMQTRCQLKSLQESMPTGTQPSEYHLPDDVVFAADLKQHEIRILERIGVDSVFISETYIPSESNVEYIVRIDTIAMGQLEEAQLLLAQLEAGMATAADSQAVIDLRASIEELKLSLTHAELIFDSRGFCLEPAVGVTVQKEIEFSARLYYWNRFGVGLHGFASDSSYGGGAFVDYRLPKWNNLAIYGSCDINEDLEIQAGTGVHIYLR